MSSEAGYFPDSLSRSDAEQEGTGEPVSESEFSILVEQVDTSTTDEELLARTGCGSKEALTLLFRRHRRAVFNVAWRILGDASEAEDLCQEVFLFLFQRATLFDASKGPASSWIIQIAYHRAIDRRRSLTSRRHYDTQALSDEQLGSAHQRLFIDEVVARTLLSRLRDQISAEQRQTLELHFFEGYSFREIAERTGQALGNVRNHYYRALERLRSCVFPQKDV